MASGRITKASKYNFISANKVAFTEPTVILIPKVPQARPKAYY
jgi:hypothetical protein